MIDRLERVGLAAGFSEKAAGMSQIEIAEMLCLSKGEVSKRIKRGKERNLRLVVDNTVGGVGAGEDDAAS
jgi:transposase